MTDQSAMYRKYAPEVFRFALYLSGNHADAEDITSETFVRAWTARESLEMSTLKGYLLTIARNLFLQQLRRTSRARALHEDIQDPSPGPDLEAEARAAHAAVMARVQQLPEIDRPALLMSAVEGVPYGDIARALGISLPAVKMKIHRSRLALSQLEHSQ